MPTNHGHKISLTGEHDAFVDALIQSGEYASAEDVVRAGLGLLKRQRHGELLSKWLTHGLSPDEEALLTAGVVQSARAALDRKLRDAAEALDRGEGIDGGDFFDQWERAIEERSGGRGRRSA